eukprot:scaffold4392_cov138-Skeletonema_marinoi.AAC.38
MRSNEARTAIFGKDSSMVKGMRSNLVWFCSMSLEPLDVRKERIIMLAEAYAIFGALASSVVLGYCMSGDLAWATAAVH